MKYSVLMSVYGLDKPENLKVALESVYDKQTRKPDEMVVVFDGPIPNELNEVLEEFRVGKEDVVKYFPQQENKTLGEALRIGTLQCTGDYLLRMDADDICDPTRIEKQAAFVEQHPEVDVVGSDIAEFDKSTNEQMKIRRCPAEHEEIVKMSKRRNPMNHVTVCIKKEALEKSGGYLKLPLLEDYYLWLRMINAGCVLANMYEALVYVRTGSNFQTRRGSKIRITGWKVLQDYMTEHNMITKKEAILNMIYVWGFVNTPNGMKKLLYKLFLRK